MRHDCFGADINILDEHLTNTLLTPRQRKQVLQMLKTCFPYSVIDPNMYFNTPQQRFIGLYRMTNSSNSSRSTNIGSGSSNDVEFIAVCFLQQIGAGKLFIHSVCVKKGRHGQKCCDRLFSYLVRNYGHYEMSLKVRVDKYKGQGLPENTAAIRCYNKYGFLIVGYELCTIENDGLNCKMVRQPFSSFINY